MKKSLVVNTWRHVHVDDDHIASIDIEVCVVLVTIGFATIRSCSIRETSSSAVILAISRLLNRPVQDKILKLGLWYRRKSLNGSKVYFKLASLQLFVTITPNRHRLGDQGMIKLMMLDNNIWNKQGCVSEEMRFFDCQLKNSYVPTIDKAVGTQKLGDTVLPYV